MAGAQTSHFVVGSAFSQGDLPDLDPSAVCLALLPSMLLLFLAALRAHAQRQWGTTAGAGRRHHGLVARPPPRLISLRLARLSVLRI
ncbi:hypothetical protein [Nonomuraea basaltis]|uniref:hypothetical protein n=1 Tax=Nonomuraea basaltis TaxID=2495887 RepID=UPI00110C6223|nr:hypothetical protein EJK15_26785 [Nonomuraea basaltis]